MRGLETRFGKAAPAEPARSTLVLRNVRVRGRRTSLRLEQSMWDALGEIALREGATISDICSRLDACRTASGLTAAVRVFIMNYFRVAATEAGHAGAGHGLLDERRTRRAS